jgi:hypothetical protein
VPSVPQSRSPVYGTANDGANEYGPQKMSFGPQAPTTGGGGGWVGNGGVGVGGVVSSGSVAGAALEEGLGGDVLCSAEVGEGTTC